MSGTSVEAAGGVVWRRGKDGEIEVLVVHRPKYDDWSLPKGKLHKGESYRDAALREVEEETGLRCRADAELPSTTYIDPYGRTKTVRYWAMEPVAGEMQTNPEVDDLRWIPCDEAAALLSYERDATVVTSLASALVP